MTKANEGGGEGGGSNLFAVGLSKDSKDGALHKDSWQRHSDSGVYESGPLIFVRAEEHGDCRIEVALGKCDLEYAHIKE